MIRLVATLVAVLLPCALLAQQPDEALSFHFLPDSQVVYITFRNRDLNVGLAVARADLAAGTYRWLGRYGNVGLLPVNNQAPVLTEIRGRDSMRLILPSTGFRSQWFRSGNLDSRLLLQDYDDKYLLFVRHFPTLQSIAAPAQTTEATQVGLPAARLYAYDLYGGYVTDDASTGKGKNVKPAYRLRPFQWRPGQPATMGNPIGRTLPGHPQAAFVGRFQGASILRFLIAYSAHHLVVSDTGFQVIAAPSLDLPVPVGYHAATGRYFAYQYPNKLQAYQQDKVVQEWPLNHQLKSGMLSADATSLVYLPTLNSYASYSPGQLKLRRLDLTTGNETEVLLEEQGTIAGPGFTYVGTLRNGAPTGTGTLTYADKITYTGQVTDGKADGPGVVKLPDGREIAGTFRDRKLISPLTVPMPAWVSGGNHPFRYAGDLDAQYRPHGLGELAGTHITATKWNTDVKLLAWFVNGVPVYGTWFADTLRGDLRYGTLDERINPRFTGPLQPNGLPVGPVRIYQTSPPYAQEGLLTFDTIQWHQPLKLKPQANALATAVAAHKHRKDYALIDSISLLMAKEFQQKQLARALAAQNARQQASAQAAQANAECQQKYNNLQAKPGQYALSGTALFVVMKYDCPTNQLTIVPAENLQTYQQSGGTQGGQQVNAALTRLDPVQVHTCGDCNGSGRRMQQRTSETRDVGIYVEYRTTKTFNEQVSCKACAGRGFRIVRQ